MTRLPITLAQIVNVTAIVIMAQILGACASTAPTATDFTKADYGVAPTQQEAAIRQYFATTLRDPYSVVYEQITAPEKGALTDSALDGGKHHFGWLVKATINAKNIYGGYVGAKTYNFLFRGEDLVKVRSPQ